MTRLATIPAQGAMPRRHWLALAGACLAPGLAAQPAGAEVMRVGRGEAVRSLASAARLAREGMTIEVEAGDYVGDVASFSQNRLTLRAVGGRVRLIAGGAHAQGKGILVLGGEQLTVEGFDFLGATAPDGNGAGIRFERGSLRVRDCLFSECQMGLLTNNEAEARLQLEGCEFSHARPNGLGLSHLLYVGRIARLEVSGCYFHHGRVGHLLKSRAAVNQILYNRVTDEIGGSASYELDFPEGGRALVLGNIVQQSAETENAHMIAYGEEGWRHADNQLWLVHNTLVDNLPSGGVYLRVAPGRARVHLINNLLVGGARFAPDNSWDLRNNPSADWDAFVLAVRENYALRPGSALRGRAVEPGPGPDGVSLRPTRQYQHPRRTVALTGGALSPGALQAP